MIKRLLIRLLKNKYLAYFVIFAIGLIVYWPSFKNDFVWDDEEQIVLNQSVHSLANWTDFFGGSTFNSGGKSVSGGLYYKPVMTLNYAVLYNIFGPRAEFFHLYQTIIHLVNSCLLWSLVKWLIDQNIYSSNISHFSPSEKRKVWLLIGWWLTLIFLVHPQNVEAVAYIASLQDVLSFFWGMLALHSALRLPRTFWRYLLTGTFLLLAVLSKETGGLFVPLTWLATIFWPAASKSSHLEKLKLQTNEKMFVQSKKIARETELIYGGILSVVIGIIYVFLRFYYAGLDLASHGLSPITQISLLERLASLPKIILFYLHTFFWPQQLIIAQHWHVGSLDWINFWQPLIIILTGAILLLFVIYRFKLWQSRCFLFGLSWLLLGLLLHSHIFPLDMTVADRWFYFSMVGLLSLLGLAFGKLLTFNRWKRNHFWKVGKYAVSLFAIVIIVLLGVRSQYRINTWRNSLTLYENDIKNNPDAFDLSNNYGVALYREGRVEEALTAFKHSLDIAPYWWTNWNNYGAIMEQQGNNEEARMAYQKAIDNGNYYLAYENQAKLLMHTSTIEAKNFTQEALNYFPYNLTLWFVYLSSLEEPDEIRTALPMAEYLAKQTRSSDFINLYQSLQQAATPEAKQDLP